jgi:hypothetical protein
MPDRLEEMIARQYELQKSLDQIPADTAESRLAYLRIQVLACTDELHEALAETGWKPWATSNHINGPEAFAELRDAWQFLMNAMMAVTGDTPEELASRLYHEHQRKVLKNLERHSKGYDGVTGKCPFCHRAYDDSGVSCRPSVFDEPPRPWCGMYGYGQDFDNA